MDIRAYFDSGTRVSEACNHIAAFIVRKKSIIEIIVDYLKDRKV